MQAAIRLQLLILQSLKALTNDQIRPLRQELEKAESEASVLIEELERELKPIVCSVCGERDICVQCPDCESWLCPEHGFEHKHDNVALL